MKTDNADQSFHPAALELMETPPSRAARLILVLISLFAVCIGVWLSYSTVDIVVSAQGKIIPTGKVKLIQASDAGLVKALHVHEGDQVRKGDLLLELDRTAAQADVAAVEETLDRQRIELAAARAQLALDADQFLAATQYAGLASRNTFAALLKGKITEHRLKLQALDLEYRQKQAEIKAIKSERRKLELALPLIQKRLSGLLKLREQGHASELEVVDAQLEVTNTEQEVLVLGERLIEATAALESVHNRKLEYETEFQGEALKSISQSEAALAESQQELIKARQRSEVSRILSPSDGTIQQVAITHAGAVVTAAQNLMVVVPEDIALKVEGKLLNKDAGEVRVGQIVKIKFEAFDFTRHGAIDGKVEWIGSDAIADESLGTIYPIRISMQGTTLPNRVREKRGKALIGMAVTADIGIGQRKLIEYFIAPILRYRDESLRER
ncbi:MAG: HlyD family type I secretion periplasmic adaptor subunit [Gammaproteobacteria bacterium]